MGAKLELLAGALMKPPIVDSTAVVSSTVDVSGPSESTALGAEAAAKLPAAVSVGLAPNRGPGRPARAARRQLTGRQADLAVLRAALPSERRTTVSSADLVALDRVRREAFGGAEGAALASYDPLVWSLLGDRNGATPENLAALVDVVHSVRGTGNRARLGMHRWGSDRLRFARTVTPQRLAAAARTRRWSDGVRPLEGTSVADPDHNGLVPGLQYVHDVASLKELRDWLVSLLPVPGGVLALDTLNSALKYGFTAAMDEGVEVEVEAGGVPYVVRILFDVAGRPRHEENVKPSARLETRVNVIDEAARSGMRSRSRYRDFGFAGRFGTRLIVSFFGSGNGGRSVAKGRSFVANNATASYTYFKPSDPVASLAVPVAVSAVVTARADPRARWRYETWLGPDGRPRTELVRTYVGSTQLPRMDVVRTDLRGHPHRLPLWDIHSGVERIAGLRALRADLRATLGADEYAFWADEIELFLGQDRMSGLILDAYNPDPQFQDVARLMLRSGDRHLSLALTAEATAVEKSGTATKKVIVDKIKAALTKPQAGRDRRGAWRWGFIGNLRTAFGLFSTGLRMSWSAGRGRQAVRSQKSYTLRAIRAADPSRVVKVDTTFTLTAAWGDDAVATPARQETLPAVDGFTQVRVRQAELSRTFDHYQPPTVSTEAEAAEAESPEGGAAQVSSTQDPAVSTEDGPTPASKPQRSWWAPTADGRHGLGYGTPAGVTGFSALYDSLVTYLIAERMLPSEAAGPEGVTPWEHLQGLDRTGKDLNRPGVEHVNWRRLVDRVSDRVLTRRIDDLTSGTAEQPGLTMVFTNAQGHSVTIGLSGVVSGTGEHRASDDLWTLNSFSGQDGAATRRTSARTRDRTHDGSLVGDNGDRELYHDAVPLGDAGSVTWSRRRGSRSGESVSGNAQSAAAMEERSSLFEVPMRLHWFSFGEDSRSAKASSGQGSAGAPKNGFAGSVRVWQADSYAEAMGDHQPLPRLDRSSTASPLVGLTPRAAVSVSGLAALRAKMLRVVKGRLRVADVVDGFSATHYKANQMNGLQGGVAVLTGMERSMLQIEPHGRPQILKRVRAYNDYTLESQTGDMRDSDEVRTRTWRNVLGYRVGLPSEAGGALIGGGKGDGSSTSGDRTAGSYRAWTGMNDLYVVRTAVRNRVTFEDGKDVIEDGEILLMLATRDVHTGRELDLYDDPFNLLGSSAADASPETWRKPPQSVRDGRPWTGVFLDTIGKSPLQLAVGEAGLRMGGPKLRVRLLQQLVGLMAHQSQLTDDGKAWEVRANGKTYQLWVQAELLDEADFVGEAARDRLKLYTRRNNSSTRQRSRLRMSTFGASGSKSTVPDNDSSAAQVMRETAKAVVDDDVAAPVSLALTGTVTNYDATGAAGNMLTMTGERPQGAAQFNQPVKFSFRLSRVDGVRAALGFGTSVEGTVTETPGAPAPTVAETTPTRSAPPVPAAAVPKAVEDPAADAAALEPKAVEHRETQRTQRSSSWASVAQTLRTQRSSTWDSAAETLRTLRSSTWDSVAETLRTRPSSTWDSAVSVPTVAEAAATEPSTAQPAATESTATGKTVMNTVLQQPMTGTVTEVRTMYSLVDGSRLAMTNAPDLSGVTLGLLPAGAKIHGIHALAAIADTVTSGPRSARGRSVPAGELELRLEPEEILTADALLTDFPSMQTTGVSYQGVNTGARRLLLPKGMVMTAALGKIRDAYHVRSAESEGYDHGTRGVTSSSGEAVRRAIDGAVVATAPVKPMVRLGGRGAAGFDWVRGESFGAVRATEHRSWLRSIPKDGLYHIYAEVA
ncbi:MAG: hypothetical protein QOE61_2097, partial [Micromonosporaceae bacterium]|nr:hypothetical protein [Micromonosporaceae bacterium]